MSIVLLTNMIRADPFRRHRAELFRTLLRGQRRRRRRWLVVFVKEIFPNDDIYDENVN